MAELGEEHLFTVTVAKSPTTRTLLEIRGLDLKMDRFILQKLPWSKTALLYLRYNIEWLPGEGWESQPP